jgi:hypothetical protein
MHLLVYEATHDGLSAEAIEELTKLFLENNVFTYNGKVYRYIKGCPLNFPLTRLLFDIYLHHWQTPLHRSVRVADEFFGLYHSSGFLTWNQSVEEIQKIFRALSQSDSFDESISFTYSVDSQTDFLNCYIENREGA